MIDGLIDYLKEKNGYDLITPETLFSYFSLQFEYWSTKTTQFGKKVMFNWTVGKKAYERWSLNGIQKRFFYENYCRENKINKSEVLSIINYEKNREETSFSLFFLEEIERKRFLNTKVGLNNCILSTSLYTEKSSHCLKCDFSLKCREILNNKP